MKACCWIILLGLVTASALQFDSDLVFDDNELSSHPELRRPHRKFNSTHWHRKLKHDHHIVSPVQSPLENLQLVESVPKESDLGLLDRAKRFLGLWGDSAEEKVTTAATTEITENTSLHVNDDINEVDELPHNEDGDDAVPDQNNEDNLENDLGDIAAAHRSNQDHRSDVTNDDEDYVNQSSGDDDSTAGSGLPIQPEPSSARPGAPQQPRFYRFTITINEIYQDDFSERSSEKFKYVSTNLSNAIDQLYTDLPGVHQATVIKIERTDDMFICKVTFDFGTSGLEDKEVIRDRLYRQIRDYRKIGAFSVTEDGFSIRDFGDRDGGAPPTPQCAVGELPCRSGECLPPHTRCDGAQDCRDGSDEFGCPGSSVTSDTPVASPPPVTTVTLSPGGVPVPLPAPIDNCRADDKVRCADGSVFICTVQRCDGIPDCPGGDDEVGCPKENECAEGEFMCDVTRCIPGSQRCDSHVHCTDGTDEQDCKEPVRTECRSDEFQCLDGKCIQDFRRCDDYSDCSQSEDEINCPIVRACDSNQWQCDSSLCIDSRLRCNGRPDCPDDDSDERNCARECKPGEFQCRDGYCIDIRLHCNGRIDCPSDDSDEKNCPCSSDEFECANKHCIPRRRRCDGYNDCQDGSDERGCRSVGCASNEFRCQDSTCISDRLICNGQRDCPDGSDESRETCGGPQPCRPDQFQCNDGLCLSIDRRCNGYPECRDGEDERGCVAPVCRADQFRCDNGQCIDTVRRCDGNQDCGDASDEEGCVTTCRADEITCGDGKCVSRSKECDRIFDCIDGADERSCGVCEPDEFRCEDGQCISENKRCDSTRDCRDGSDELDCEPKTCSSTQFTCRDASCIESWQVCDRRRDCADGSDEANCDPKTCSSSQFTCGDGSCIESWQVCDRRRDCVDGSDEVNCGCQTGQFQCQSGECIPNSSRCDGRVNCRDSSDELNCGPPRTTTTPRIPPAFLCPSGQQPCRSGTQCIAENEFCNGRYECNDLSDEDNCGSQDGLNLKTYPDDQIIKEIAAGREVVFQCRDEGPLRARVRWSRGNGLPLPPGSRDVRGRLEIPDIQVEHSGTYICEAVGYPSTTPGSRVSVHLTVEPFTPLPTRPPTACQINQATCSNGDCIPKQSVCDGKFDCTDGSDEMRCSPHGCEPNEFRCENKKCVLKTWRCDGDDDCGDGSDESNCATNPPGSPCRYHEFSCRTGNQCIPKSFHCDQEVDCLDGSDEVGCSSVYIQTPPPPMIHLEVGSVLSITCTAVGVPTPEVVWRLNWGHIPSKCTTTSSGGTGTLVCPDIQESDQGAYSCEAINIRGSVFAIPDAILVVNKPGSVCRHGSFNDDARSQNDCITCFCFGVTTDCKSADLFTYQLPPPISSYKIVGVHLEPALRILQESPFHSSYQPTIRPLEYGFQVYVSDLDLPDRNTNLYFTLPDSYIGNQLKSYGGYLKFTLNYRGNGDIARAPDIILSGNGYVLAHNINNLISDRDNSVSARFFYGEWTKLSSTKPGDTRNTLATREEIMMALANTDSILIRLNYFTGSVLDTSVFNIGMDSAGIRNTGQGRANFVEECRCPAGYMGLSCEQCAPGYNRRQSGPWLGLCTREPDVCPTGYYGDPSRNVPCQVCPCPLTTPSNQFARTCFLDTDGQVTCNCPEGYIGRRCEQCGSGYQGDPLRPGDSCSRGTCDVAGSISSLPNQATGQCECKEFTTGQLCNQCKSNTFFLDTGNQYGCIECFCMGITNQCRSSSLYRSQVTATFARDTEDFRLVEAENRGEPITDGVHVDFTTAELVFQDFSRRSLDAYYWQLPSRFLGNKITSYGGTLKYTVRYVPTPGGQSSRNSAADVEIISVNNIRLLYFGREQIEPNRPQTINVPLLEQYWQQSDGRKATRADLLMALADLEAILIKATYTTNTREAALANVILDVSDERNTGQSRALAVEQCECPRGYNGNSCEDCDVGYARTDVGRPYLGTCQPCNCHGHSIECDRDTGICQNCRDYTTGDHCELCKPGYRGDATRGTPYDCEVDRDSECNCDPRGSTSTVCPCICKTNVQGINCDECRGGTFSLSTDHVEGCLECFCSGVTSMCSPSNLYRTQIPMQISDQSHGFTLTDRYRTEVIEDGFVKDIAKNELGHIFSTSQSERLFWSLPPSFTGNRLYSYGGNLTYTQRYTARPGGTISYDTDVIITGNGISLFWSNVNPTPERSVTVSVPLYESQWRSFDQTGQHTASRRDLLTVLSNVEAILIRASPSTQTLAVYISDLSLDTAVTQYTGQSVAIDVETCQCPPGYRGTSCESCSPGYYRDYSDRSLNALGSCTRCPCNSREESCSSTVEGDVTCQCQSGFTGRYCENIEWFDNTTTTTTTVIPPPPVTITLSISEPTLQIVEAGSTVRYHCRGRSLVSENPVRIFWSKEHGVLPLDRATDDGYGLLVITNVRVSDSGTYICSASDGISVATERATLTVGGSRDTPPRVTVQPSYLQVRENEPVEFRCSATGTPAPVLHWISGEDGKQLSPFHTFYNGVFRIPATQRSDQSQYVCRAINPAGEDSQRVVLYVAEGVTQPPPSGLRVEPSEFSGSPGETVRLSCLTGRNQQDYRVQWSRPGGLPLPSSAVQREGTLTIHNASPANTGIYVCTATSYTTGETSEVQARVTIISYSSRPTVHIEPERQTVGQGSVAELRCVASGEPTPRIRWSKAGEDLATSAQITGQVLRIINAQVRDRGVYVCTAENDGGVSQASAIMEVERREPPVVELYPETQQTVNVGGSALLQCRATGGIPPPRLKWSRQNGQPLSTNVETLQDGSVIRFSQISESDEGQYVCHASNDAGMTTAVASLIVQSQPVITLSSPTTLTVSLGQRVRLECHASGRPQPIVTWSRPSPYSPVTRGRQPEETPQSAVYEISSVTRDDEGSYSCTAHNQAGTAEERLQLIIGGRGDIPGEFDSTDDNELYPQPPPTRPDGVRIANEVYRVPTGGRAEMRCTVSGNRQRIYLNWQRADSGIMPADHVMRDGILYLNNIESSAAGEYACQGIDQNGNILFTAITSLVVIAPPRIQLQPPRQVVRPGDDALITCSATGDQPIAITWSAEGRALPPSVSIRDGLLQFRGIAISDAGRYVCRAVNPAGEADAVAEVIVNEHQQSVITAFQRDVSTSVGSNIQLRCEVQQAAGYTPQVTWSRDRQLLPPSAIVRGEALELTDVQVSDQGRYICEAESPYGKSSDYIDLRVDRVSTINLRLYPSKDRVHIGDNISVRCTASGTSGATYSWSKVRDSLEYNVQTRGDTIWISNVRSENGGVYRCTAATREGNFTENYVLAIQDDMNMTMDASAVETRTAPYGSSIVMDCRTDLEPPVTFRWSKPVGSLRRDADTESAQLTIHDVRAQDAGTYICTAQNVHVKMDIPTILVVTGVVPYFAQAPKSYMVLPTLPDAYLEFSVEISFRPESSDGLILYNGEKRDGAGDFISLGLNQSYLEFRFNLGSGTALIRSPSPISLGEWHTVKLVRKRKEGKMYIDDVGPYNGVASGAYQGLDLVEPLYVGGVPNFHDIHRLNGFTSGFVGCISRLLIHSVESELVRDATISEGVTTCETCAVNPCHNQGVCQEATQPLGYTCICPTGFSGVNCQEVGETCYPGACNSGRCVNQHDGFKCYCPFGKQGRRCENDIEITEPAFSDDAFIAYPTPKALRRLKMALKFNPIDDKDALLLYSAQNQEGTGDFTSLAIKNKKLEFKFDTGSGPAVIRSEREIVPGEWVSVSVGRSAREGHLSINNEPTVIGHSQGSTRGLNLRTPLFVGGYDKDRMRLSPNVGVHKGFHGCISEVMVSGSKLDIVDSVVDSANIQDCKTLIMSSCDNNPCLNGGTCTVSGNHYNCSCPKEYIGKNCEIESDLCQLLEPCQNGGTCVGSISSYYCKCPLGYGGTNCHNIVEFTTEVSFQKNGYLELNGALMPHTSAMENEIIIMEFSTTDSNGLIFWHGQLPEADGKGQDYLALAVVNGYLEFSYELGSGPANIQITKTRVDDGKRHKVVLKRQANDGSMELDSDVTEFGSSPGILTMLNTKGNIYIGGVPDFQLMTAGKYSEGFSGCIHSLELQDSGELHLKNTALSALNVLSCPNEPSTEQDDPLNDLNEIVNK